MTSNLLEIFVALVIQLSLLAILVGLVDRLLAHRYPQFVSLLWIAVLLKAVVPPIWLSQSGFFSWVQAGIPLSNLSNNLTQSPNWLYIVGGVWLVGFAVTATFVLRGWIGLRRHLEEESLECPSWLTNRFEQLVGQVGLVHTPRLVISESLGPFVLGYFRPVVCLPQDSATTRSWGELEPILMHELVHLRRRDTLLSLLQVAVNCIWWFHPLVWLANKKLSRAVEFSVDQAVTTHHGCDQKKYAHSLMHFVDVSAPAAPALTSGISPSWITGLRIRRVLQCQSAYGCLQRSLAYCGFAFALVTFLPGKPIRIETTKCIPASAVIQLD